MTERKSSVADGLAVCWAVIFTVWCAATGHMIWWLASTAPLAGLYFAVVVSRLGKERGK